MGSLKFVDAFPFDLDLLLDSQSSILCECARCFNLQPASALLSYSPLKPVFVPFFFLRKNIIFVANSGPLHVIKSELGKPHLCIIVRAYAGTGEANRLVVSPLGKLQGFELIVHLPDQPFCDVGVLIGLFYDFRDRLLSLFLPVGGPYCKKEHLENKGRQEEKH